MASTSWPCPFCPQKSSEASNQSVRPKQPPYVEVIALHYPKDVTNETARKVYKNKRLTDNPETLFADLHKDGSISNLIFYTNKPYAWHKAIITHYPSAERKGICGGFQLKIRNEEDTTTTNVNIYKTTGIVVVKSINGLFEQDFLCIKDRAQKETITSDQLITPEESVSHTIHTDEDQTEQRDPSSINQTKDPHSHCYCTDMRERFTELEGEMVQLKEMIFSLQKVQTTDQTSNSPTAKHREKDSLRRELSTLQTEVKELQQEREGLRAQLETLETLFLQQTEIHRAQLTAMKMEIRELKQDRGAQHSEFSSSEEPVEQDTPHPDHSSQTTEIQHSQNPPLPSDTSLTSHSDDLSTPTEVTLKPEVALLIDSNGKFIDEKKLFPKHRVAKLWCPNTQSALKSLSVDKLGSPNHIIIHTGTNDLRAQQERVATSLQTVIEKASTTFPHAKITISTLLPRKDFHPDTIQRVNANLSRACALKPNVHLAHHPTLDFTCLYDHVHLYKTAVPVFAKTLKDVALNRNRNSTPRSNRVQQPPPRPVRKHSVPPERTSRRLPSRQQHSHMLRPSQPTPEHLLPALTSSHSVNQARPKPLLPTPYPLHTQQAPGSHSYAQIVSRKPTTGPVQATTTELRDIRQMLNLICSHLLS